METVKTLMEKIDTLQRDVEEMKKPGETDPNTNDRSRSRSRDMDHDDSSRSQSRPKKRERGYSRSRSPVYTRQKNWADRMEENE